MVDGASVNVSDEIRSAVAGRRAVLFCGPGVSVDSPATLPDWKMFRDETIRAVASAEGLLAIYLPAFLKQGLIGVWVPKTRSPQAASSYS